MSMNDVAEAETRAPAADMDAGGPDRNEVFGNLVQGDSDIVGLPPPCEA